MRPYVLSAIASLALVCLLPAQSPMPVIVPAATPGSMVITAPPTSEPQSAEAVLKMLREMKSANEETLKKQAAVLEQLDELEKAAEQIRLYTRRS